MSQMGLVKIRKVEIESTPTNVLLYRIYDPLLNFPFITIKIPIQTLKTPPSTRYE